MSVATVRDGRRLARPLQAVHVALRGYGSQADTLEAFHRQLELPDEAAMSPGCLDPDFYQGWAWWAERMLEAAGEQPVREPVESSDSGLFVLGTGVLLGLAWGVALTWAVMR